MSAGPARPRPWPVNQDKTVGQDGVIRLTAPLAWRLYSSVVGYHAPKKLRDADMLVNGINFTV